jgi:GTP-binding protein YchF
VDLGILGWPASGKTTLFAALTGQRPEPGSAETHRAVVKVPDPRVDELAQRFKPRKVNWAEVVFVDPAGERNPMLERPSFPETLLEAVRDVDALVLVIRAFEDPSVPRPPGSKSPAEDLLAVEQELILRDLERVEKRLERLAKEGRRPETATEKATLEKARAQLDAEGALRDLHWDESESSILRGFQFLSLKPILVVHNIDESALGQEEAGAATRRDDASSRLELHLCARIELELLDLDEDDRAAFLEQLGLQQPARDVFLRKAYELLKQISFFTVGEDEVRAWAVRQGATAPEAAGRIHTDLQRGFIRAEVIHYDAFLEAGSMAAAKAAGTLRLEGKQYVVQDGDIMHVRHA